MIFRFAVRNLIRFSWRTFLYFSVVFGVVLAITASLFVCVACENAMRELDEEYIFVASVIPSGKEPFLLTETGKCLENTEVLAYNVVMAEASGVIPIGEYMTELPSVQGRGTASELLPDQKGIPFLAVENLSLLPSFFNGTCTISQGTGITAAGYSGEESEIVIPWWLAEAYDISVGDTLIKRYEYGKYTFFESRVVGIYQANVHHYREEEYPAYIPLAVAEIDYGYTIVRYMHDEVTVQRADFVLGGRDAFEAFVLTAKENGFDFQKAKIVFNNRAYDSLSSELANVHMIALIVCGVVLGAGLGILWFFTVYLYNARKGERVLLASLGMTRGWITAMLMTELAVVLIVAIFAGIFGGYLTADGISSHVNSSVLSRADMSEMLEYAGERSIETLSRDWELTVSVSASEKRYEAVAVNYNLKSREDEIGVSKHTYQFVGTEISGMKERDWLPVSVVGVSDLNEMNLSLDFEVLQKDPRYRDFFLYGYVSESSPYAPDEGTFYTAYYINGCAKDAFVHIDGQNIGGSESLRQTKIHIIGTYSDTEYCMGDDVLLRMEDYHTLYSEHSVTGDGFYFERIGAVYPKEGS